MIPFKNTKKFSSTPGRHLSRYCMVNVPLRFFIPFVLLQNINYQYRIKVRINFKLKKLIQRVNIVIELKKIRHLHV